MNHKQKIINYVSSHLKVHCKRHCLENEQTTDLSQMFHKQLFEKQHESRVYKILYKFNNMKMKGKINNKNEHKFEQFPREDILIATKSIKN